MPQEREKIPAEYYLHDDVVWLARDLLGKVLVTEIEGIRTAAIITETEAYSHLEKGCHAYGGKMTGRNRVMFGPGGQAYVYLCYGIHHLFNIVTNRAGIAEAVLIRGVYPLEGLEYMLLRRKKTQIDRQISAGPGTLSQALGITTHYSGHSLTEGVIWLENRGFVLPEDIIRASPRIGIDYAGEDALLPWRFYVKNVFQHFGG